MHLDNGVWHHVCITWENIKGNFKIYLDGQLATQGSELSTNQTVKPGGFAVLGQDQDTIGGDFVVSDAFVGELAEVNLWDVVLSATDVAAQYRNGYIPQGSVIQWSEFTPKGAVEIGRYSSTVTSGKLTGVVVVGEREGVVATERGEYVPRHF